MSEEDVTVLGTLAGLSIDPAHVSGIIRNLEIMQSLAEVLAQACHDPVVEPAPVFHP